MIRQILLAWALRITGMICFIANGVRAALIRDRNHLVKPPQLFVSYLLKRYECLLLLGLAFTNLFGYMIILYSLSDYAVQIVGLTQAQAGISTSVLNLQIVLGGYRWLLRPPLIVQFLSSRSGYRPHRSGS